MASEKAVQAAMEALERLERAANQTRGYEDDIYGIPNPHAKDAALIRETLTTLAKPPESPA